MVSFWIPRGPWPGPVAEVKLNALYLQSLGLTRLLRFAANRASLPPNVHHNCDLASSGLSLLLNDPSAGTDCRVLFCCSRTLSSRRRYMFGKPSRHAMKDARVSCWQLIDAYWPQTWRFIACGMGDVEFAKCSRRHRSSDGTKSRCRPRSLSCICAA